MVAAGPGDSVRTGPGARSTPAAGPEQTGAGAPPNRRSDSVSAKPKPAGGNENRLRKLPMKLPESTVRGSCATRMPGQCRRIGLSGTDEISSSQQITTVEAVPPKDGEIPFGQKIGSATPVDEQEWSSGKSAVGWADEIQH